MTDTLAAPGFQAPYLPLSEAEAATYILRNTLNGGFVDQPFERFSQISSIIAPQANPPTHNKAFIT